jgi:sigma-E factor negative regulatory protein RseA
MNQWSQDDSEALERLSAMVDGEAESGTVDRLCAAWREQPAARASWHAYHLIGDVLRSEDLSSDAQRDAAFLRAVRERLAREPVVLAPSKEDSAPSVSAPRGASVASTRPSRWRIWSASIAVAAGFVAVAGALLVTQAPAPLPAPALAGATDIGSVISTGAPAAVAASVDAEPQSVVGSGKVIRDARLEHYLAAHKQFAGSSALGVPSGFLRAATAEVPNR